MDLWVINSMLFKLYLSYRVSMVSVESTIGCSIFIHGIEFHCRNLVIRFNLITLSIIRFRESLVWPLFPLLVATNFRLPVFIVFYVYTESIDSSRKSILVTTPRLDNFIGIFQWLDVMSFISLDFIGHNYWFICQFFFVLRSTPPVNATTKVRLKVGWYAKIILYMLHRRVPCGTLVVRENCEKN